MAEPAAPVSDALLDLPNRELVETSMHFARAFLHWLDGTEGGLSYPRLRVLETLHCLGPARMRDLADELGLPARNLTTVADGLEAEHLVKRVPHPTDRRATLLELTATGRDAAESSLAPRLTRIAQLFDVLSPRQQQQLLVTLRSLLEALDRDCR